jgi:tetratricopeptide (TPR) repeat protein
MVEPDRPKKLFIFGKYPEWLFALIFLPITLYFRFIGGTWLVQSNDYDESLLNLLIICIVFCCWLLIKAFSDRNFYLSGVEKHLLVFVLVVVLSTVFSSNRGLSLEMATGVVVLCASTNILLDIKRSPTAWEGLIDAAIITGGVNVLMICLRVYHWFKVFGIRVDDFIRRPGYVLDVIPRLPDLPNFNANMTQLIFLMLVPLMLHKIITSKRIALKLLVGFECLLAVLIIFLTRSRGVYLGIAGMGVAIAANYWKRIWTLIKQKTWWMVLIGLVAACVLSVSAIFVFRSRGGILGESLEGRFQGWKTTGMILLEHPLFGSGLGTFPEQFLKYRDPEMFSSVLLHAHNEILQILAQLGVLGLLSLGWLFYGYFRILKSKPVEDADGSWRYLLPLAGFLGKGLVDAYFESSTATLMVAVCLVGWLPPRSVRKAPWNSINLAAALTILLLLFGLDYYALWKLRPYQEARLAAYAGDWEAAVSALQEARDRDPGNPFYLLAQAQAKGQIACRVGSGYQESIELYQQSLDRYGGWGSLQANLAGLYERLGAYEKAEVYSRNAIARDPSRAEYHCMLGDSLLAQGQDQQAVVAYAECIALEPGWLDTPYWKEKRLSQTTQTKIVELAQIAGGEIVTDIHFLAARINWYQQNLIDAETDINEALTLRPDNPLLRRFYANLLFQEDPQNIRAEDITRDVLDEHPRNYPAWMLLGKMQLSQGEAKAAVSSLELSTELRSTPENLWWLGSAYIQDGDLDAGINQIESALNWTESTYRLYMWIARRFPLPGEELPCLPEYRTVHEYYQPAANAVTSLDSRNCCLAVWYMNQLGLDRMLPDFSLGSCPMEEHGECP